MINVYHKVIIIDFGSQYTALIAKQIRNLSVYAEIYPYYVSYDVFLDSDVKAIILSGGPKSVYDENALKMNFPIEKLISLNKPILGICYGMQFFVYHLGGQVKKSSVGEYGSSKISIIEKSQLFSDTIPSSFYVWMNHADSIINLPKDFKTIALSDNNICVAAEKTEISLYLLQFHPEVYHTEYGKEILSNFLFKIVQIAKSFNMQDLLTSLRDEIKNLIKENSRIICALSGGVDSVVTSVLLHQIAKERLICIFINHGFLREDDFENFRSIFEKQFKIPLRVIDGKAIFLNKIRGIIDPEEKRKIIGNLFIEIFEEEALKEKDIEFLAQGTLYSDLIESQQQPFSDKIKSHHNVGGLPEKMNLTLIEPLKGLFKDEVRELGRMLEIPDSLLYQHPFPGPGFAIRILGDVEEKKLSILKKADKIFIDEIKKANLYPLIWQAFPILSSDLTVGIKGDQRVYGYTIVLRAVSSVDAMTAEVFEFPFDVLKKIANKITNNIYEVNRVVYDITSKPPGTIEWQ